MKLHLDTPAFETLIRSQSDTTGLRPIVIEKDYYVSLILQELAEKQRNDNLPAYFKGGTALYKALKCIRRFSEDIDLTVFVEDCPSKNQKQKRLEEATKKFLSLPRDEENIANKTELGSITSIYKYDSVAVIDSNDFLKRFRNVKIEATSFTVSEPHQPIEIAPLLYENANIEYRQILKDQYQVSPFMVETIKLERIFIDKVFAAEFYFQLNELHDMSKHLYDIVIMLNLKEIQELFMDEKTLDYLISLKRQEELSRKKSTLSKTPISTFEFFIRLASQTQFTSVFNNMQKNYVLDDQYLLTEDQLFSGIEKIRLSFKGR